MLLLAALQIAPVAPAKSDEAEVVELLSTGRIKTSATWCYKKPGPERCAASLHIKEHFLRLDGVGCGSFRVPVNGSNGRQTAKFHGNTLTVTVIGRDGSGVNTYELSPDLTQCTHRVGCPAGFQAKVFSCSVERDTPRSAVGEQGPPAIAALENEEQSAHRGRAQSFQARSVDAQSYLDAAKDLKEREPSYNSLLAAVQTFRRAAIAFGAAGDIIRARAATAEAEMLENEIKDAEHGLELKQDQNQCRILRGNALECYSRATRAQQSPSSELMRAGQARAFLDCVKTYCDTMRTASCAMPPLGKDNTGFCFATATGDEYSDQQEIPAAKPQPRRSGNGTRH